MQLTNRKENHLTYFKFFFGILRFKVFIAVSLNILIGLLDGLGITILFPLLQSMDAGGGKEQSIGQLKFVFSAFEAIGIPLTVNAILIVFVVLFTIKGVVKYFASLYQMKVQQAFIRKLQFNFLDHFRKLSYNGYLDLDAGKIQNTLIAEVLRVSQAMNSYFKWSNSVVMLLTYVVLAYLANPEFAFLITVGVGIINFFYQGINKKIKAASFETSKKGVKLNSFLIELVHYFKYLKSTSRLNQYVGRLRRVIHERYLLDYRIGKLSSISISIKEPTVILILVIVMMIQVNFLGGGISSIILSLLLFYRGLAFLLTLQTDWQSFIRQSGSFRMVNDMFANMKAFEEKNGENHFTTLKSEIRLKDVCLSFGKHKVLKNVSIEIPRNKTIALTGVSGSGKTTAVNILSGLIKPSEGKVLVDGRNLDEYDLDSYRGKIGYISQESVVFNDTIFNNVTFWDEPTVENKKRFWEVIELASLTDFMENQPEKENTCLGDNGILISGGQRQRISIARELYKKPEILILDEATSALDSETERTIQHNIENLHGSITLIIIAHRLSTVKNADRIYLIENGNVVNSGKFSDMIEHSSKFKNLVTLQGL